MFLKDFASIPEFTAATVGFGQQSVQIIINPVLFIHQALV